HFVRHTVRSRVARGAFAHRAPRIDAITKKTSLSRRQTGHAEKVAKWHVSRGANDTAKTLDSLFKILFSKKSLRRVVVFQWHITMYPHTAPKTFGTALEQ
uniref:Uncharacterized protein n=1 Tax=Anopheles atroparvus TaxID=41427 RepID=A0AAG5CT10_ANOAO